MGYDQELPTTDDYYTPKWVFETMGLEFDLDVASPPGGGPWIPANKFYTMKDDGLSSPWEGRVWMNPPFSNPTVWMGRFLDHHHGICLVVVSRSKWFSTLWESDASLVSMPTDMKFTRGGEPRGINYQTVLAAFGEECVEAISRVGVVR
jgi:hypothetical protein